MRCNSRNSDVSVIKILNQRAIGHDCFQPLFPNTALYVSMCGNVYNKSTLQRPFITEKK